MTSLDDIALLRLYAQRLAGPPAATARDAVQWLTAVQAQDLPGALTTVALRTSGGTTAGVVGALADGSVVRAWPMRGTLHLTAAEDLPWMLSLLAPRVVRASRGRRTGLKLDEPQLERARELAVDALTGGRWLRRSELFEVFDRAGVATTGQRGVHILRYLAMTATIVFGPMVGSDQLVVLLDEWILQRRELDRDEALGELALRYFRSHGPATGVDLTAWAGLTAAELRTSLAFAAPALTTLTVDDRDYFLDPATLDRARDEHQPPALLLPGFDELVLGYRDRRAQLDPAFAERIVPGGNGMFRPTVVDCGRIVGTWSRPRAGNRQSPVTATAFTSFSEAALAAIAQGAALTAD